MNSHLPPSQDGPGGKAGKGKRHRKARPSRPGVARPLAADPDRTERCLADSCPHCQTALAPAAQRCRHRYDHIDLPEIRPVVTRVELFGGRCGPCGRRYRAEPPATLPPGTPFGPGIRSLLAYLHHSHHVGFERLSRLLKEVFGLAIDCGDSVVAPKLRDHLRWAIRVGKRRPALKDSTLAAYAAKVSVPGEYSTEGAGEISPV